MPDTTATTTTTVATADTTAQTQHVPTPPPTTTHPVLQPTYQSLPPVQVLMKEPHRIHFPPEKSKSAARPDAKSSKLYDEYKHLTTTLEYGARGFPASNLKWDLERGICVFDDPALEARRVTWAAEQKAVAASRVARQRGGILGSQNSLSMSHTKAGLGILGSQHLMSMSHDSNDDAASRFDISPLGESLLLMTDEEIDGFRHYLHNEADDMKEMMHSALANAHSSILGMAPVEYKSFMNGERMPNVLGSDMSLREIVHDSIQDMLLYNHAGVGNSTGKVNGKLAIRLVTADDIVIVPEEMIDLEDYNNEQRAEFVKAFAKELKGLADIGTFEAITEVPPGKKAIPSKNVYKIKLLANGSLDKFKTRTTIKGFHQRPMEDYFSTFSPTGSLTILRLVLVIAVHNSFAIWQADIPQAFVQSDIDAQIIMMLPAGSYYRTETGALSRLVRLVRSLYGTKQAPQLFNHDLNYEITAKQHFTRCDAEPCLYYYNDDRGYVLIFSCVDDLIVTGSNNAKIEELHAHLEDRYSRDPKYGELSWKLLKSYYGINFTYDRAAGVLSMDVEARIDDLLSEDPVLSKLHGSSSAPVNTPAPISHGKGKSVGGTVDGSTPNSELLEYLQKNFRHVIGILIFTSCAVRLDITEAVSSLACAMSNPTIDDAKALRHLLRYLDHNRGQKLTYKRSGNAIEELFHEIDMQDPNIFIINGAEDVDFVTFSDSNFAPDGRTDRKSSSGNCSILYGCTTSWKKKLQPIVAPSVHAAELIAVDFAGDDVMWHRRVMLEIWFAFGLPPNPPIDSDVVLLTYVRQPQFTPHERDALFDDNYHSPQHKAEFVAQFLADDAPTVNRLMVTITPLPEEQFEIVDKDTTVSRIVSSLKRSVTGLLSAAGALSSEGSSRVSDDEYRRKHTTDGTLRRYTHDIEPVEMAAHKLGPTNVLGDNKGVTFTVKNPLTSAKSRCLDTRWFRMREFVKQSYVRVSHIFTHQNVADFFTKPLIPKVFLRFRRLLMNDPVRRS